MTTYPSLSLRIPRGLWHDLETTVYQQDRQFLTEVARSLGLPPAEVIKRCIGVLGTSTAVPVLWTDPHGNDPAACPYWECHGQGLWRRCPRLRIGDTLPCVHHERDRAHAVLDSDPVIQAMPWRLPVRWEDVVYWVDPDGIQPPFAEDGTVVASIQFKRIQTQEGEPMWVRFTPTA